MTNTTSGMDLKAYLRECRQAYVSAVMSGFDPLLLTRIGGAIGVAAKHTKSFWTKRDPYVGIIEWTRDPAEVKALAWKRWSFVEGEITAEISAGHLPTDAVRDVMQRYDTVPHTIEQMQQMNQLTVVSGGKPRPYWIAELQDKLDAVEGSWARASATFSNPFGAVVADITLIATAEDWTKATPKEWDLAHDMGQLGALAGEVASAKVSMRQAAAMQRQAGASAQPAKPVTEIRPQANTGAAAAPRGPGGTVNRGVSVLPANAGAAAAPRGPGGTVNRGTDVNAAPRGTGNRGVSRPSTKPEARGTVVPNPVPEGLDEAFTEWTPPKGKGSAAGGRRRTKRQNKYGYDKLDGIAAARTPSGRKAIDTLAGKFPEKLRKEWAAAKNNLNGKPNGLVVMRMKEVRRLAASKKPADKAAAEVLAREKVFNPWRERFWRRVRKLIDGPNPPDPALKKLFADAGLEFATSKGSAPFWRLPDGTKEELTIDHFKFRIMDDPTRCVDHDNLVFSPKWENSGPLETIRDNDPFQRPTTR